MVPLLTPLLMLLQPEARAFRIAVHRDLTEAAVAAEGLGDVQRQLWLGNRAEDTRLNIKWRHYSHYFRPDAPLHLARRGTSDQRVAVLWIEAKDAVDQGDVDAVWQAVGGMLHHIQDMASPPHVVPVAHDLRDGFEGYSTDALMQTLPLWEPEILDPVVAHERLAWDTWEAVRDGEVTGCGQITRLSEIWQHPQGEVFGSYGALVFGDTSTCPELEAEYARVIQERLSAAVQYSRAVLQYTRQHLLPEGASP